MIPGRQLPAAGVRSFPPLTMKILVAFVSETKPSTSSITASAAPALFAWILGFVVKKNEMKPETNHR